MKTLLKIVAAVLLVLIIAAVVVVMRIDAIAKNAIEKGGTYALGVNTTVDSVSIGLLGGTFNMEGLAVANPAGFEAEPHLLKNQTFDFGINTGSVFSDTVEVDLIRFSGLDVWIIKKDGKDNVKPILENLKKFEGGEKAKDETGSGKEFIVKKIVIENVTAHVDVPPLGQKQVKLDKPIVLENVTKDNAQGMLMSEIMARLYPLIMSAVVQSLGDMLPADLLAGINGDLGDLANKFGGNIGQMINNPDQLLQDVGGKAVESIQKQIGDQADKIGEQIGEGAGKAVEDAGEKLKEGVGNLFGGEKKQ